MQVVEIPGGTANLRDKDELKVKQRRAVERASAGIMDTLLRIQQATEGVSEEDLEKVRLSDISGITATATLQVVELQDVVILALLESWTLTLPDGAHRPEPASLEDIGELEVPIYDALANATRKLGNQIAKGADFGVNPDPKAPITSSESSSGTSGESLPNSPIPASSANGENISTDASMA